MEIRWFPPGNNIILIHGNDVEMMLFLSCGVSPWKWCGNDREMMKVKANFKPQSREAMETLRFPHGNYIISTSENDDVSILWCLTMEKTLFPPVETIWTCGFHMDTRWLPCGHHMVSRWTPFGFQVDTIWFPSEYHVVSTWTPHGVQEATWKPTQKKQLCMKPTGFLVLNGTQQIIY